MHKIKEMLMNELYEYEDKAKRVTNGKISQSELDKIHKLTDTIKNIDKIEMLEDGDGYSGDTDFMGEGRMYGVSYARGRGAKRDSMGRYSRDGGMHHDGDNSYDRTGRMMYSRDGAKEHLMKKAEEMLDMAKDHKERRAIEKLMRELEDD